LSTKDAEIAELLEMKSCMTERIDTLMNDIEKYQVLETEIDSNFGQLVFIISYRVIHA